jgi:hypothetical protein
LPLWPKADARLLVDELRSAFVRRREHFRLRSTHRLKYKAVRGLQEESDAETCDMA